MKHVRKIFAFALTLVMAFAIALPAFAESEDQGGAATSTNTITINKAARGETYAVYKVLGATENGKGGIDYIGPIPAAFNDYLESKTVGSDPNTYSSIGVKADKTDEDLKTAAKNFVESLEGMEMEELIDAKQFEKAYQTAVADGNSVVFNVEPGYYVVVSTQGTTVMVDSTKPNAIINEKNTTTVSVDKTVEKESYSIGDTIKYTVDINTANYQTVKVNGKDVAKPVTKYTISDTLPAFLSNVEVTSIKIGDVAYPAPDEGAEYSAPQFDQNKKIEIPWADFVNNKWTSKYVNGTVITIEYTATLTEVTNIGRSDKNVVTVTPTLGEDDGTADEPTELKWTDNAEIKTYAAALHKTDGTKDLAGAEFQVAGLTATKKDDGVWVVTTYNPSSTATPTTLTTDENGRLYIVGLASNASLSVTETKAPAGYNKLNETKPLSPQLMETTQYKTESWAKYDAYGNLIDSATNETANYTKVTNSLSDLDADALTIVNNQGTELPSTGGIGTTIFYVVGGVMVAGAVVFLLTKRRVNAE